MQPATNARLQAIERRNQCLRNITAAKRAVPSAGIGELATNLAGQQVICSG